jgi:hypothetical protein
MVEGRRCILTIGREASQGSQTGEQNAEDRSCDAGCRWVRACRCMRRFCGTSQWRGYYRTKAFGGPRHSSPGGLRTRPAPTFWTLRPRMRTWLVPALSAGSLPAKLIAAGFWPPFPASVSRRIQPHDHLRVQGIGSHLPISPPQCGKARRGARHRQIKGLASERGVDRRGVGATPGGAGGREMRVSF